LSCAQIGTDIYWVNGFEKGYVRVGINNSWVKTDYYGPETKRTLSDPPTGNFIIAYSGVLYIATGSAIYHSDQYSLNHFDLFKNNFPVEANITMLDWVSGGIFVGTDRGVWFLAGTNPGNFQLIKINESRVIRGTAVKINLDTTGFKQVTQEDSGIGLMWTCFEGIYLGTPAGRAYNLTYKKLFELEAVEGSAQVINGRYIVNLAD
jgi:ligand-binding sensor domain-containing protein